MGYNAVIIGLLDAAAHVSDDTNFSSRLVDAMVESANYGVEVDVSARTRRGGVFVNAMTVASCRHADEDQVAVVRRNSCRVYRPYGDEVPSDDDLSALKAVLERAGYSVRKKRAGSRRKALDV